MTIALEQSLHDLCAKHDLTTISLDYSSDSGWSAYAHWANSNGQCGVCFGGQRIDVNHAVGLAIADAYGKRKLALVDVALPDATLCIEVAA